MAVGDETSTRGHAAAGPATRKQAGRSRLLRMPSVREDYQKRAEWTLGEAAKFAGVSYSTVRTWQREPIHGRRRWKTARVVGPLTVSAMSFQEYIRTGEPQGEAA